jgi:hypothetical protein
MKLTYIATYFALAASTAYAVSVPNAEFNARDGQTVSVRSSEILAPEHVLEKRKGGGGKGGGGSSGGGSKRLTH